MASRYIPGSFFQAGSYGRLGALTRFFTTLDPAFQMHWTIPTHTSSGDFTHNMKFAHNDLTMNTILLDGGVTSVNESFLRLDPVNGSIDMIVSGGGFLSGSAAAYTADTKQHDISLSRSGNDYSIKIDGVEVQTFNQTAADFLVDKIGIRANGSFEGFSGVLSDVDLDGDRFYPIDEDWIANLILIDTVSGQNGLAVNIDQDDAELFTQEGIDWLAVELVENMSFDSDSIWTKGTGWTISGGTANYDGTGGTSSLKQLLAGLVESYTYRTKVDVISNTGSVSNPIDIGSTRYNDSHLTVGSHAFVNAHGTGTQYSIFGRASEPFVVDNISVKRILEGTP